VNEILLVFVLVVPICILIITFGLIINHYFCKPFPCHYWIGWEDKRGNRAYSSWLGQNPDDALYTFSKKHQGYHILACTPWLEVAIKAIRKYPWSENGEVDA
jgi:hypothetical protein